MKIHKIYDFLVSIHTVNAKATIKLWSHCALVSIQGLGSNVHISAAFKSLSAPNPHLQVKIRAASDNSALIFPQHEQVLLLGEIDWQPKPASLIARLRFLFFTIP